MIVNEASDFCDEHEFGEFEDVEEVKDMRFVLKKKNVIIKLSLRKEKSYARNRYSTN